MVPIRDLDDDYYEYEKEHCLRSRKKHRTYSLGEFYHPIKLPRPNIEKETSLICMFE